MNEEEINVIDSLCCVALGDVSDRFLERLKECVEGLQKHKDRKVKYE